MTNRWRGIVIIVTALVLLVPISGCSQRPIGEPSGGQHLEWDVPAADHWVSTEEAQQQAAPVIDAIMERITRDFEGTFWDPRDPVLATIDGRCGHEISRSGLAAVAHEDYWDLHEAAIQAAEPFGYTHLRRVAVGGPNIAYGDIADDGTMLTLAFRNNTEPSITVLVPAADEQCD